MINRATLCTLGLRTLRRSQRRCRPIKDFDVFCYIAETYCGSAWLRFAGKNPGVARLKRGHGAWSASSTVAALSNKAD